MTALQLKVKASFDKASRDYDNVAIVQRRSAAMLAEALAKKFPPCGEECRFLDVGAGTGLLTVELMRHYKSSYHYYLTDISNAMLNQSRQRFLTHSKANINYILGDMWQLDETKYDFVVSNLMLQWMPDLSKAIKFLANRSKRALALTTLLEDSFAEWEKLVAQYSAVEFIKYPSIEQIVTMIKSNSKGEQNFDYWQSDISLKFGSILEIVQYFKQLGANSTLRQIKLGEMRKLLKEAQNVPEIKYKIFFAVISQE